MRFLVSGARYISRKQLCHVAVLFAAVLPFSLTGCSVQPNVALPPSNAPAAPHRFRAALVLDTGGVDDKSFNAGALAGLRRAQTELHLADSDIKFVESKTAADYKTNLAQFASQGYDVIFAVGYRMQDALKEIAPQYPAVKFAIVDGDAPNAPNCAALKFREEQGSCLAGFLAASMSKSRQIGFVGGEDIPLIRKFEAGYRAGAKIANPAVQVRSVYTNDWNDLDKGKQQAELEFGAGADIIFHATGKAGLGVIDAAREHGKGFYAIGVDMDQDSIAPGRVLTSMVKHVDNAVYDVVVKDKAGKFTAGAHLYDLKENGVGLSDMRYTKGDIPPAILTKLGMLKAMIFDGRVTPPTTVEAVAAFVPPKL